MLNFDQSSLPETNGHRAPGLRGFRGFVCANCNATTYRTDQDGDLSCTACGRLFLFESKAVNGAPSLEIKIYAPDRLGVKSARRHTVKYVGETASFNDTTIEAVLRKPKDIKPRFEIGCPYCPETVFVGFIAPRIQGVKRWRVKCANHHVVFVAPTSNGVPATWWA